ncbi:MAG: two-component sensor histidine kinase [Bacillaceae bacterium]|uniref:sensor histidine kinase n=1 Tax=Aeribacillus composti TaxID=1868734 RepID=UPI000E3825EF|nr:sensor histidine kinase [Aeribacillus composti]REJ14668.1 MAG: two-component sensor histidine kinase [Bacillaceae bacterium]
MNIRTKLFIFIPLLVILLNTIAFFIFDSGKKVQKSYDFMVHRIYLYKQISNETQENLRYLSSYLIYQDKENLNLLIKHKANLEALQSNLSNNSASNALVVDNYKNMINTFLQLEEAILINLKEKKFLDQADQFKEIERVASFIREDSQQLVDMELSEYQPVYNSMLAINENMNKWGGSLFIVTTALSIVFAIWLSRSIVIPIQQLVQTAKQVAAGDLNTNVPIYQPNDEVGVLGKVFNQMIENLRKLISKNMEILEKEKLMRELELKALQSQINPHFLFNTLNVISKLAYIEGAEKTSELTISTSNLLRYNLRKLNEPVMLREEIENAKEYFAIQKARFRDRISFQMEIDNHCLDQSIPALTIQPLLENAFVHGIESMESGAVIELSVKEKEGRVLVKISDNGVGMDEKIVKTILESPSFSIKKSTGHSTGLGMENVFRRLRLFYQVHDIVDIKSKQGRGTTILLSLPRVRGEKMHV